jgi:signal-transduction protein with cAMP-binding, CBS, and nucleotidyltransferase domain
MNKLISQAWKLFRWHESACNAKRTETILIIQDQTITTNEVNSVHNYPPPSALPPDSEIRQAAKKMLSNGMSLSMVFKNSCYRTEKRV